MSELALEWKNVSFAARQGFWMKLRKIVQDIDISVPPGTVLGLVGPNGAGKTTTIKLGAGLLHPLSGKVLIKGISAAESKARKSVGLLTENQYIYPHLRLREWLEMLAGFSGIKGGERMHRVDTVLEAFELSDLSQQLMHTLSKGQLQRAGLAQAFVHKPEILLLDEPMSGLDPYWRYRVQQILTDFKSSGGTILFSSHILMDVERLSDQIVLIKEGRVQWHGCPKDMQRKIKAYEAICRSSSPEALKNIAEKGSVLPQPAGEWRASIPENKKEELLQMVSQGKIDLLSLRPIQEEIEEILFALIKEPKQGKGSETK
ncbi:MAG: ABC transporter ATP-binding protein [Desulfobacterales bacterium]